jgi:hypothetical protein
MPRGTGRFTPATKGATELGDPDQWQKCLTSRPCMGNGEKKGAERMKKPRKIEAAMEGTL